MPSEPFAEHPQMAHLDPCADSHDPFWPRISLNDLRSRLGVGNEVSEAQLLVAARGAAMTAAREFAQWRHSLRERGFRRLETLAGHAPGRALQRCYLRSVEMATRRALLKGAERNLLQSEVRS
ncbi:head completion/stabilization protein [Pseudomonas cremoricolorata]|uniref:head completion/stabilization protein n=1 Tax=Pseudomonas cremoricolorata TaxID=157783 RepID=UPI0003F86829|nr:head completion/stabilization protein [Pseudomonas cremoricolorata]